MEMTNANNEFTLVSRISVSKSLQPWAQWEHDGKETFSAWYSPAEKAWVERFQGYNNWILLAISLQINPTKWGTEDEGSQSHQVCRKLASSNKSVDAQNVILYTLTGGILPCSIDTISCQSNNGHCGSHCEEQHKFHEVHNLNYITTKLGANKLTDEAWSQQSKHLTKCK